MILSTHTAIIGDRHGIFFLLSIYKLMHNLSISSYASFSFYFRYFRGYLIAHIHRFTKCFSSENYFLFSVEFSLWAKILKFIQYRFLRVLMVQRVEDKWFQKHFPRVECLVNISTLKIVCLLCVVVIVVFIGVLAKAQAILSISSSSNFQFNILLFNLILQ